MVVSTVHILVIMTSSLSQFELAKSFQNGGINRMHEGFPLPSDVSAKKKMSDIFSTFKTDILKFQVSVKGTIVALGENEQEFENVSSEVRFYVAFKLHDVVENW